jgi:hypothetical protein
VTEVRIRIKRVVVPPTSLIVNAYSVTSGLILIFKMYDLVILFIIYRLMHALFHIKTVIIPRDRYRPEGRYRSRDDNSPDMEKGMH